MMQMSYRSLKHDESLINTIVGDLRYNSDETLRLLII